MEIRDNREQNWFWVSKELIKVYGSQLGPSGIAVYCALAMHVNPQGQCWPSYKRIADSLGMGRSTVIEVVKKLAKLGLISISHRTSEDSADKNESNIYTLLTVKTPSPENRPPSPTIGPTSPESGPRVVQELDQGSPESGLKQELMNKNYLNKNKPPLSPYKGERKKSLTPDPRTKPKVELLKQPFPKEFSITTDMKEWAKKNTPSVNLVAETEKLEDWARSKAEKKADWIATWRNWMRRRQEEMPAGKSNANNSNSAAATENKPFRLKISR